MKNASPNSMELVIAYNLSIQKDILDICKPLFDNFGISYFEYIQITGDGQAFYISTNKDWLQFSINHRMFEDVEHVKFCSIAKNSNQRYVLWDLLKLDKTQLLSRYKDYDIWNGLTINEFESENFSAYSFATTINNTEFNNFYINNFKLFDHFIIYFQQKLKLLTEKHFNTIFLPATPLDDNNGFFKTVNYLQNVEKFLEQTTIKRFYIKINNQDIYLTNKELLCLSMLASGKTMKGIGIQLKISSRTVEDHLNSIKLKTGITFKHQLISFFENYKFPSLIGLKLP